MIALEENLKRLQTHPVIDRETALRCVNVPLYLQWKGRQACIRKAAAKPLPGPLLGAFFDNSIEVGDKHVCRVLPAHFLILEKINSPLLDMLSDAAETGKAKADLTTEQKWQVAWMFTHSPKEMLKLVSDGGSDALQKAAQEIALSWEPELVEAVIMAVFEQMVRHVKTKAKLINDMASQKKISFLAAPNEPQESNKTA